MASYKRDLEDFENYMILKNFSKSTREAYGCALKQFFKYHEGKKWEFPYTDDQAKAYVLYRYKLGRKWQTINGDYSAMRKFFTKVRKLSWDVYNIPRPRKESQLPEIISQEEVKKLIENASIFKHQAIFTLFYTTGIRLSELLHLKPEDIDSNRLQIHVHRGKGLKDRYVQVPEDLIGILRSYYRIYRPKTYLFNGKRRGYPLSPRAIAWALIEARKRGNIKKRVSAHTLRHCYATHHLENGTDLIYLQQQLGHKHLKTTARYIHLCMHHYRKINHPIAKMEIRYLEEINP